MGWFAGGVCPWQAGGGGSGWAVRLALLLGAQGTGWGVVGGTVPSPRGVPQTARQPRPEPVPSPPPGPASTLLCFLCPPFVSVAWVFPVLLQSWVCPHGQWPRGQHLDKGLLALGGPLIPRGLQGLSRGLGMHFRFSLLAWRVIAPHPLLTLPAGLR